MLLTVLKWYSFIPAEGRVAKPKKSVEKNTSMSEKKVSAFIPLKRDR